MNNPRPSFLLVDGNNIIHAWPELLTLHQQHRSAARDALVKRLRDYQDNTGTRVVVVFDGTGSATNQERDESGLQIFYTGSGATADDVIERLALKYAASYPLTVATDDRAEQDLVVSAGAEAISSIALKEQLEAAEQRLSDWLVRRRKSWERE